MLGKKHNSITRAAILVALLTVISKILGFGREALIASYFGASAETDAFFFAHSMPEMVFPSVCNSISTAFITLYISKLAIDKIEGNKFASRMLFQTILIGIVLAIIGVLLSPFLVKLFAPGFSGGQFLLAIKLTKITMAAFVLIMIQYMMTAILNSNKVFVSSQIAGLFYNLFVITITFLLHGNQSMEELTLTVVGGSIILIVILFVFTLANDIKISISNRIEKGELRSLLKLALPIMLGNAVIQINSIADRIIGSLLPTGSVSALSYSTTLCNIVTGVFITSLSTVLYPSLSHDIANNNTDGFLSKINKSITIFFVILIPISIVTILDSLTIVSFVYGRGNFDTTAIDYTSFSLMFYGPMFAFYAIREVLSRSFFALQDTKTPMLNTSVGVGINIVLSIVFSKYIGIGGIALGTSISTAISSLLLLYNANKKIIGFEITLILRSIFRTIVSAFLVVLVMLVFKHYIRMTGIVVLIVDTIACLFFYFIALSLFYKESVILIFNIFKSKKAFFFQNYNS